MTVDFNFPVLGLHGRPLTEDSLARLLAEDLSLSGAHPAPLILSWAETLWQGLPLVLEGKEAEGLVALIESSNRLPVIVRGTAIRHIYKSKVD